MVLHALLSAMSRISGLGSRSSAESTSDGKLDFSNWIRSALGGRSRASESPVHVPPAGEDFHKQVGSSNEQQADEVQPTGISSAATVSVSRPVDIDTHAADPTAASVPGTNVPMLDEHEAKIDERLARSDERLARSDEHAATSERDADTRNHESAQTALQRTSVYETTRGVGSPAESLDANQKTLIAATAADNASARHLSEPRPAAPTELTSSAETLPGAGKQHSSGSVLPDKSVDQSRVAPSPIPETDGVTTRAGDAIETPYKTQLTSTTATAPDQPYSARPAAAETTSASMQRHSLSPHHTAITGLQQVGDAISTSPPADDTRTASRKSGTPTVIRDYLTPIGEPRIHTTLVKAEAVSTSGTGPPKNPVRLPDPSLPPIDGRLETRLLPGERLTRYTIESKNAGVADAADIDIPDAASPRTNPNPMTEKTADRSDQFSSGNARRAIAGQTDLDSEAPETARRPPGDAGRLASKETQIEINTVGSGTDYRIASVTGSRIADRAPVRSIDHRQSATPADDADAAFDDLAVSPRDTGDTVDGKALSLRMRAAARLAGNENVSKAPFSVGAPLSATGPTAADLVALEKPQIIDLTVVDIETDEQLFEALDRLTDDPQFTITDMKDLKTDGAGRIDRSGFARAMRSPRWVQSIASRSAAMRAETDGWKSLELTLDDGEGSVTIRVRKDGDLTEVALAFTDANMRTLAEANFDRIRESLTEQYGNHVDLSFADTSDPSQYKDPSGQSDSASVREAGRLQDQEGDENSQIRQSGSRNLWIG